MVYQLKNASYKYTPGGYVGWMFSGKPQWVNKDLAVLWTELGNHHFRFSSYQGSLPNFNRDKIKELAFRWLSDSEKYMFC